MFDPSQMTLGELSTIVRNLAIVAVLLRAAWGARGFYDSALSFMSAVHKHMIEQTTFNTDARKFMTTVTDNHLKHIEEYTKVLATKKDSAGK
jgi:hypothetical protein